MEFIKTSINTADKKAVYRMTKGDSLKVQDLERGTSFPVDAYAIYKETKTRNKQDGTTEEYTDTVLTFVSGNMKIGTMLMTKIIERARKMNLLNIELEVVTENTAAIALYHKMGFSDVGVYRNYWFANNAYSDAIVMQKCLDD